MRRELFPRAPAADDRSVPAIRGTARAARRHGKGLSPRARAAHFSTDDIRDLQVWHKLVWIDAFYFERDERVRALVAKGRGFTEEDKAHFCAAWSSRSCAQSCLNIAMRRARGQIELSTSPFYHPILPLLCDTDVYLRTHPQSRMPRERFRRPEDAVGAADARGGAARTSVWTTARRPVAVRRFCVRRDGAAGRRVRDSSGWPPTKRSWRGPSIAAFTRDGAGNVDQPEDLYRAVPRRRIRSERRVRFPRSHPLGSDWLHLRLMAARQRRPTTSCAGSSRPGVGTRPAPVGGEATVFVILDGENAWEHFEGQGRPFLRALYARLASHPELPHRDHERGVRTGIRVRCRRSFRDRGSTRTSTSGLATRMTIGPGVNLPMRAARSTRRRRAFLTRLWRARARKC